MYEQIEFFKRNVYRERKPYLINDRTKIRTTSLEQKDYLHKHMCKSLLGQGYNNLYNYEKTEYECYKSRVKMLHLSLEMFHLSKLKGTDT